MSHNETHLNDPSSDHENALKGSGLRVIVHSFFVIPFFVALACVIVIWLVRSLTADPRTARDLLTDVKTGGLNKRWQAAFELARIIHHDPEVIKRLNLQEEFIRVFEQTRSDEPNVRHYLALAMGRSGDPIFFPVLEKSLKDAKEETDRLVYCHALGMLRDPRAVAVLTRFIDDDSARVRSMTAAALASLDTPDARTLLKKMLHDEEPNVQWIATLALADVPTEDVIDQLLLMLDDDYWTAFPNVDNQERFYLMRLAVEAASGLNDERIHNRLIELTHHDNMAIRQAAYNALKQLPKKKNEPRIAFDNNP